MTRKRKNNLSEKGRLLLSMKRRKRGPKRCRNVVRNIDRPESSQPINVANARGDVGRSIADDANEEVREEVSMNILQHDLHSQSNIQRNSRTLSVAHAADILATSQQSSSGFDGPGFAHVNENTANCNVRSELLSELEDDDRLDVNRCAVAGISAIGQGHAALQEFTANVGIPCPTFKIFKEISAELDDIYVKISEEQIIQNGKEELRIAHDTGSFIDGIPACSVIVDGSWPVRSYNSGGRAESGMAVIIGAATKKILFVGYRNRYCLVCTRANNRQCPIPNHRCFVNYPGDKSILSVESDVIVQGFTQSLEQHGLIYHKLIGDGDSSVIKKVRDADPYPGLCMVSKGECRCHLQRCRVREIREVIAKFKTGRSEEAKRLKTFIFGKIQTICTAVTCAANFRRGQEGMSDAVKISLLKQDMKNVLNHVFGSHGECADYFCDGNRKENEVNLISVLRQNGLYDQLQAIMDTWTLTAEHVLAAETANLAECFNSVLAKFIYHKGVNVQLRGMYPARIAMAAIQFNNQDLGSCLHEGMNKIPPQELSKMESQKQRKNYYNTRYVKKKKMPPLPSDDSDAIRQATDYGRHCERPDMDPHVYAEALEIHKAVLCDWQNDRENIERKSRSLDPFENMYVKKILFSHNFGRICRMRKETPTAVAVKEILYPSSKRTQSYTLCVKRDMKKYRSIQDCGVIIDKTHPFLAAKPDGNFDDGIVIIYCPYSVRNLSMEEAMSKLKLCDEHRQLKKNNPLYYEVIGSLAISQKKHCQLYICTAQNHIVIPIIHDEAFWRDQMVKKLCEFYEMWMIPEIVDSRYRRSMNLRDKSRCHVPCRQANSERNGDRIASDDEIPEVSNGGPPNDSLAIHHEDVHDAAVEEFQATELSNEDFAVLMDHTHGQLEATHIDVFGTIVSRVTQNLYQYRSPSLRDSLLRIEPIEPFRKHIQILNRGGAHWVCAYYDTRHVYIYDSLRDRTQPPCANPYLPYLQRLFPYHSFDDNPVIFREVQQQTNCVDCGVFAIAFAITLMYGLDPENIVYEVEVMRDHLLDIYINGEILHFPISAQCDIIIPELRQCCNAELDALISRLSDTI
nr:PREDICTED: uncharacterized protein LOC105266494 [Fopius arisanus]